jgi:hypothetical protein
MIVSPRAKEVTDVLRIENQRRIIEINEVFLYRRTGLGTAFQKILYWKRGEDNSSVGSSSSGSGGGSCNCDPTPSVILAETDYYLQTSTFDSLARVLDNTGQPTGNTIQIDHIIENNNE